MREKIVTVFEGLLKNAAGVENPQLSDETVLLQSGLDSLGFAVLVTELEEALGFDPFSASDEPYYPVTLGDLVAYYERHAPRDA